MAEAVENGIAAVSIAGIVKRAKVSAGTVYVHFENKDDMLRQVYLQLKADFHGCLTRHRDEADTAKMVRHLWFDMFDFVRDRPQDFLFLDYAHAAKLLPPREQAIADEYAEDIAALLRRGVDDGTLAPMQDGLLSLLLVAPAMQLARGAVLAGRPIPPELISQAFDRVWLSIANP
ncbi:Transcriptional regulator, AcrR family protein [Limimaricola hongkongensis DSM 17492]|uniref:Transcriptional regulator, AcrR family protein n=1 Tax=Limimaricola hongkongensis DSM 17492 TaxID=1122180 RepID=A0A017HIR7_9RHOB|nr:Transcriptional regulator, AcrR family protein [Limimaricola hongkongensis DSM 17492]